MLDRINETHAYHILTIEDPIEFMHRHKKSIIHQRELHSDTPSFALALRAALRQAPKVILVGEMRDKETIEIALEAAETGHSGSLHAAYHRRLQNRGTNRRSLSPRRAAHDSQSPGEEFRFIVSQRLIPRKDGNGRVAIVEILKSTLRTREYLEKGEHDGKTLLEAMQDGDTEGMQHFDGEIEKLVRVGLVRHRDRICLLHQSRQPAVASGRLCRRRSRTLSGEQPPRI
jgi:twitching motility protein PilT